MEKIKNILCVSLILCRGKTLMIFYRKPGKSQDDETLYGTGQSTGASHPTQTHSGGLTGEGSHLGSATKTPQTTNPTILSNHQTPLVGNIALGAASNQTTQSGSHMGQGNHLASATCGQTSNLPTHTSGVTTTTTTQTHTGQSHLGRDTGLAGAGATGVGLAEQLVLLSLK